jgi:hypothetical protein
MEYTLTDHVSDIPVLNGTCCDYLHLHTGIQGGPLIKSFYGLLQCQLMSPEGRLTICRLPLIFENCVGQ